MTDHDADVELEILKRRKLSEMERSLKRAASTAAKAPEVRDHWAVVGSRLVGRGGEVLEMARAQYADETEMIVKQLAALINAKKLDEPLSGELLFTLFRSLGLAVRLETKIVYSEHGRVKSLAEKLMGEGRFSEDPST